MSFYSTAINKDAIQAFAVEDLKALGIKPPKLEKIVKSSHNSISQNKCENGLFGVPLPLLPMEYHENLGHVPKILISARNNIIQHLDKEGLFRKTGSVARQKDIMLRLSSGDESCLEEAAVFDVTSLIKQFFRELPDPLIPTPLQECFIKAIQLETEEARASSLRLLSLLLPLENMAAFRYILELLYEVSNHAHLNRMDSRNLAVCITPNFFHTKQNSKLVHLQTDAVQICIHNAHLIAVVPSSVLDRAQMLVDLEMTSNMSIDSGNISSSSKKKRAGSLSGVIGSIRRSIDKMRNRRSISVPDSLNALNDSTEYGFMKNASVDCTTPQIRNREPTTPNNFANRCIIDRENILSTPMSMLANQSDREEERVNLSLDSRVSPISRRKGWITSPFSRRKRSLSSGPAFNSPTSPAAGRSFRLARNRTSNKTKKLIRKLSGDRRHKPCTPDMLVGERLACSSDVDNKMSESQNSQNSPELVEHRVRNQASLQALKRDLSSNSRRSSRSHTRDVPADVHMKHAADRLPTVKHRACSADGRSLPKRGQPNHERAGLPRVRLPSNHNADTESLTSLQSTHRKSRGEPLHKKVRDSNSKLPPTGRSREHVYQQPYQHQFSLQSEFDCRMEEVANRHSGLFTSHDCNRRYDKSDSVQRCTSLVDRKTEHVAGEYRRISSNNAVVVSTQGRDDSVRSSLPVRLVKTQTYDMYFNQTESSMVTVLDQRIHEQNSAVEDCLTRSDSGVSLATSSNRSKSSILSKDSGTSHINPERESRSQDDEYYTESVLDEGMLIDEDDLEDESIVEDFTLQVRGALVDKPHHDSLLDLHTAGAVQNIKSNFTSQTTDEEYTHPTDCSSDLNSRVRVKSDLHLRRKSGGAPVRIPTVFAKNDPRALRIKAAADEVRRRKLSKTKRQDDVYLSPCNQPRVNLNYNENSPSENIKSLKAEPQERIISGHGVRIGSRQLRQEKSHSPARTARIPISTDLAKHVIRSSELEENEMNDSQIDRTPLKEQNMPRIKPAMLNNQEQTSLKRPPLPPSNTSSRKSPRKRVTASHRLTPYSRPPSGL